MRRPDASKPALPQADQRLVEGQPEVAQIAQRIDDRACVALEERDALAVFPAATRRKPERIGEVVQRHHGLDAPVAQAADHGTVAVQRRVIDLAGAGLDTAPLDAQPMGVEPQPLHVIEIALGIGPPIAGEPAAVAVPDGAGLLLVDRPLVVAVVAFCLVRG